MKLYEDKNNDSFGDTSFPQDENDMFLSFDVNNENDEENINKKKEFKKTPPRESNVFFTDRDSPMK